MDERFVKLRNDVCYWRSRRNDCAHYKDSEITLSHVSAFWVFMMDNYNKFTPIGGLQQSINDYNRHFDISLPPRGTSTERIFKRLCLAIKTQEDLEEFLKETSSKMDFKYQCDLVHDLLIEGYHKKLAISFLKGEKKRLKAYLCAKPKDVSLILGNDPTMTRNLWFTDFRLFANNINVYTEMLQSNMIPKGEIKESLKLLLSTKYNQGKFNVNDEDAFKVLMDNGLYDIFIDDYLTKESICHNPREKCCKTDFYIPIIRHGGITEHLILTLSESVKGTFPYTFKDRLRLDVFNGNDYRAKYNKIIERLNLGDFFKLNS